MSRPQIVESPALMRERVRDLRRDGATVGFVPTMGALHEGHLSLVEAAAKDTDVVVVSVFVNPTQFAPGEDFERYPRRLEADVDLLAGRGVDVVFAPGVESMYPPGSQTTVRPGALAARWEGEVRPDHFEGVATVVTKLLSIVGPDVAFFGEKDYQQLRVVQQLAADLDLGVRIVGCPIVREADGLALSSRNAYLSPQERAAALGLSRALAAARSLSDDGVTSVSSIERAMVAAIAEAGTDTDIDYAAIVDADTLEPLTALRAPARAIIAARVGATRLIDNCELTPAVRP